MEALNLLSQFRICATGILHVGANIGHEFEDYRQAEAGTVVYVEPVPRVFEILKATVETAPGHHAVQALCSATAGEKVMFNVSSNGAESSSIFALGNHGLLYPTVGYTGQMELTTTTVDDLIEEQFPDKTLNLMVIDVQGAELMVLQGAQRTLERIEAVYCEVADISLYEGSCTWQQITEFLGRHQFRLKHLAITPANWGNALFLKETAYASVLRIEDVPRPGRNVALNKPATQSSLSPYSSADDAAGAVNGMITGSFGFHTAKQERPWWQVDLLETLPLQEIMIFNRMDACGSRAYALTVKLGDESGHFEQVHAQNGMPFGGRDGRPARIRLEGTKARYVRIELPSNDYLHLDEVEVYAAT